MLNRFSDRRIWPYKVQGLWIFVVNLAESWILKTHWTVDQLRSLARIPDCACHDVRILGPKRNLDHRCFFSLGHYINEVIQIIYFSERSLFKRRCETVIGIVLCCSHQACCLQVAICAKSTMAFTLPLNFYTFCFRMWLWFRIQYACFKHFELCQPLPFETTLYLVHSLLVLRGPLNQVRRDRDQVVEGRSEIKYRLRIPSVRACVLSIIIVFVLYESSNHKET